MTRKGPDKAFRDGRLVIAKAFLKSAQNEFVRDTSLQWTKAPLIYRRTGNLREIESTVRYLGIEVDDALFIAEQVDV